jgi:hypothetical protein
LNAQEQRQLDEYLARMGVQDGGLRQRLAAGLPAADAAARAAPGAATPLRPEQLVRPLCSGGLAAAAAAGLAPVFVIGADPQLQPELAAALAQLRRPCYALDLPPAAHLPALATTPGLASLLCAALKGAAPAGPYIVAGVGAACVVAYEVAVQLQGVGARRPWVAAGGCHAVRAALQCSAA